VKVLLFERPATRLSACVLALASLAWAQNHDPVPTRIKVESYGGASGTPEPGPEFQIRLDANPSGESMIRVSGGWQGELAGLFIGLHPSLISLPFNAVLLVDPVVSLFVSFDRDGNFNVPLNLASRELIRPALYFQGFHHMIPGAGKPDIIVFQFTEGMKLIAAEGNVQPPTQYVGPPLTATLIASTNAEDQTSFEVLNRIEVPTTHWDLRLESVNNLNGVTRVYLTLEAPGPNDPALPVVETKRVLADLGFSAGDKVEIHIQQVTRGVPSIPAFHLAAMIETDF